MYLYFNTLYFFIYSDSVDSENIVTSKYADIIEYNPYVEEQVTNSEDEKEQEDSSSDWESIRKSINYIDFDYRYYFCTLTKKGCL